MPINSLLNLNWSDFGIYFDAWTCIFNDHMTTLHQATSFIKGICGKIGSINIYARA